MQKIVILGTVWNITERSEKDDELLKECDGYCDSTTKTIVIEREITGTLGDMEAYVKKVKRHEIVHAFLDECGLCESSASVDAWARNEEMVDWFARVGPKIFKVWKDADLI